MVLGMTFVLISLLIILIWLLIEIKRMRHKVFAFFLIGLVIFLYFSITLVFRGVDVDYKSISGLEKATGVYFSWLGSAFHNVKTATANAIHMDWSGDKDEGNKTKG